VNSCLPDEVADRLELPQSVLELRMGVAEAAGPGVPERETTPGVGFSCRVAPAAGGVQRRMLRLRTSPPRLWRARPE
jgi:hypothetical protein